MPICWSRCRSSRPITGSAPPCRSRTCSASCPAMVYGWPKNILHWQGIGNSIFDINSSLPLPQFAIVDGIVGMEGNGPLQGQAKATGVLVFGDDLVAVDATAARLMTLEPHKIDYLANRRRVSRKSGARENRSDRGIHRQNEAGFPGHRRFQKAQSVHRLATADSPPGTFDHGRNFHRGKKWRTRRAAAMSERLRALDLAASVCLPARKPYVSFTRR